MVKKNLFLLVTFLAITSNTVHSQQYSFSTFAFRIYDKDSVITTLYNVTGFNHFLGTKIKMDSISVFEVKAMYLNDDVDYQQLAKHKDGIWILFSENVKQWRPLRFFSIQKKQSDGELEVMRIFLNYNYHSCEMPCIFGQSEFKVSDIQFNKGNFMLLDRTCSIDWKEPYKNVVRIQGDILSYLLKNNIILWDIKMIK